MIGSELDRRYAAALLDVASQAGVEDRVGEEIAGFAEIFGSHKELKEALLNPVFSKDKRHALLDALFEMMELHKVTRNFLKTLLDKDRVNEVAGIAATYSKLADEKAGRIKARLMSARELDPSVSEQLKSVLEGISGKKVELEKEVDRSLIGGLVVRVGDLVFDGSLRSQLDRLRQTLSRE